MLLHNKPRCVFICYSTICLYMCSQVTDYKPRCVFTCYSTISPRMCSHVPRLLIKMCVNMLIDNIPWCVFAHYCTIRLQTKICVHMLLENEPGCVFTYYQKITLDLCLHITRENTWTCVHISDMHVDVYHFGVYASATSTKKSTIVSVQLARFSTGL